MPGTYRASGRLRCARTTLATLAVFAAGSLAYRFERASEASLTDLLTSIGAAFALSGAMAAGWMHHVQKVRERGAAEWEAKRLRRDEILLDGEEDQALWDSVEPWNEAEETCEIGVNVIALHQYRGNYPQAG